jgi:hypothetical protein
MKPEKMSPIELLLRAVRPYGQFLLQPLVTVAMLLFLYAGWHVRDEGSVAAGLRVAFIDTRAYRQQHDYDAEAAELQRELRHAVQSDAQIDQLLTDLLAHIPKAARIRLSVVHNGVTGVTGVALLRADTTNAVAAPGHSIGPMTINQPLSDWNEFLPVLLTGHCFLGSSEQTANRALRARLDVMGADKYLACPITDTQNRMLGTLSVTWDNGELPPTGEALRAVTDYATTIATQVATALDKRGHMSPRAGAPEAE